jgi:RNA polymerase sigma-70 factor (ECF subfamily)
MSGPAANHQSRTVPGPTGLQAVSHGTLITAERPTATWRRAVPPEGAPTPPAHRRTTVGGVVPGDWEHDTPRAQNMSPADRPAVTVATIGGLRNGSRAPSVGVPVPLPDDSELVTRLLAGDEELFARVVQRYHRSLRKVALTWVRTPAAADETVQDTWLAVMRGLPRFEGRSSFKTWLFRILANRAKSRAERDRRMVPLSSLVPNGEADGDDLDGRFTPAGSWSQPITDWQANSAERLAMNREVLGLIETALTTLPALQRAVLTLRDIEGLDGGDVCRLLTLTPGNQRVLLHRARATVREVIHRHVTSRSSATSV